jgi:hypothetical protein
MVRDYKSKGIYAMGDWKGGEMSNFVISNVAPKRAKREIFLLGTDDT